MTLSSRLSKLHANYMLSMRPLNKYKQHCGRGGMVREQNGRERKKKKKRKRKKNLKKEEEEEER